MLDDGRGGKEGSNAHSQPLDLESSALPLRHRPRVTISTAKNMTIYRSELIIMISVIKTLIFFWENKFWGRERGNWVSYLINLLRNSYEVWK